MPMRSETNALVLELLAELTEPLIVVNRSREIVFRSRAFTALCGEEAAAAPCGALLLPPAPQDGRPCCCWNALEVYLGCAERGLWQIARPDGGRVPVLCEVLPVGIGAAPGMLAMRLHPLDAAATPIAAAFFSGLRGAAEGDEQYFETATAYLKSAYGIGFAAWFRIGPSSAAQPVRADGLKDAALADLADRLRLGPAVGLHDVVFRHARRERIAHVVRTMDSFGIALAFGRLAQPLDERLIDAARAAVSAPRSTTLAAPHHLVDQALHQTLSDVERETLDLLTEGLSDKEIARRRCVSLYTVKHQVARIMKKAGVDRRTKLIGRVH